MSGGVDSSAVAVLLQQAGYEVIGLFMRSGATVEACATTSDSLLPIVTAKPHKQGCCSASDAADARRVADSLDIPFHALNFQNAFTRIKDYFADEYLAGRTPNPCVMCNNWLKFGKLWEFARQVGASKIASGHYARVETRNGATTLLRGVDRGKDQSYVLFGLSRDLLANVIFPCGPLEKSQIRVLAQQAGLKVAAKPDSQEICFVPDNDYAGFLRNYREVLDTAGDFVDCSGNVLGAHAGYEKFTVGQRRGLGVAFGEPRFVVRIHAESRQVVLGTREELSRGRLTAGDMNWHRDLPRQFSCLVQIRSMHRPAMADVSRHDDQSIEVTFEEPQFGVAPGQACVLYSGEAVLGGWVDPMTIEAHRYSQLDSQEIIRTAETLHLRVQERFPTAGLCSVALRLAEIVRAASERSSKIARPILWVRTVACLLAGMVCSAIALPLIFFEPSADHLTFSEFLQVGEAGMNEAVLIGAALLFVFTLETRLKRQRALTALHELRSLAHIIDMHQLTKDPEHVHGSVRATKSSPKHSLTPFELERYLDYCSEMLSIIGKVAALYVQNFADTEAVSAVNDIEDLTSGLSRKIWQKIVLIHSAATMPPSTLPNCASATDSSGVTQSEIASLGPAIDPADGIDADIPFDAMAPR